MISSLSEEKTNQKMFETVLMTALLEWVFVVPVSLGIQDNMNFDKI